MELQDKDSKIEELAVRILALARSTVIIALRFLDTAISKLKPVAREIRGFECDGSSLYYNARELLEACRKEKNFGLRLYLHVMLHYIFAHPYFYNRIENDRHRELFSIACDIAAENVILGLGLTQAELTDDARRKEKIRVLNKYNDKLTAHSIYKYFLTNDLSEDGKRELTELFTFDKHDCWKKEEATISLAEWERLSERIKADLKSFSKNQKKSEALSENLEEATRDKYNYSDILRRFAVMGEEVMVNDEEFDYVYYNYGLSLYKNMPLIEPLEYKETKKVREFVIVLDTSASCQGKTIRAFLSKTYSLLKNQESFFSKVNVRILQCDNEVQQDIKITCNEDFEEFIRNGKLTGFGGTDFRPAFAYVDELIFNKEFENLKGLIYFTDGFGTYPEYMPSYDSMFVFLDEDSRRGELPPWAIKVVISEDELE